MASIRALAAAAILAGAAIGVAGPASADPLDGPYTHTITDKTGGPYKIGAQTPWILSPCGPNCLHVHQAVDPEWDTDLHLEGNRWTGIILSGRKTSFDKDSLVGEDVTPFGNTTFTVSYTLTKG